jgi:hypothetical protein
MTERAGQLVWLLDHLDDLDADFRVFYRITGIGEEIFGDLSGPRFFALAFRTIHYRGVMRDRVMSEQIKEDKENSSQRSGNSGSVGPVPHARSSSSTSSMWSGEVKEVPLSQLQALHPGIVEHQVVG